MRTEKDGYLVVLRTQIVKSIDNENLMVLDYGDHIFGFCSNRRSALALARRAIDRDAGSLMNKASLKCYNLTDDELLESEFSTEYEPLDIIPRSEVNPYLTVKRKRGLEQHIIYMVNMKHYY